MNGHVIHLSGGSMHHFHKQMPEQSATVYFRNRFVYIQNILTEYRLYSIVTIAQLYDTHPLGANQLRGPWGSLLLMREVDKSSAAE
jgi:hypothetical protein